MIKMQNNLLKEMLNLETIDNLPLEYQDFISRASGELMDKLKIEITTAISELQALEFDLNHDPDVTIGKIDDYSYAQYQIIRPIVLSFIKHIESELQKAVNQSEDDKESEAVH